MGCPDPRPAPAERWARASVRVTLVGVVAWALAVAPVAAGYLHAEASAASVGSCATPHHAHHDEPSDQATAPDDEAKHDLARCLACLVGAWAAVPPSHHVAASRRVDRAERPPVAHVLEEHLRHVRSRAPPAASVAR